MLAKSGDRCLLALSHSAYLAGVLVGEKLLTKPVTKLDCCCLRTPQTPNSSVKPTILVGLLPEFGMLYNGSD